MASRIIVLDVETTGLPQTRGWGSYYPYFDTKRYKNARVLQVCILVYDTAGTLLRKLDQYICPFDMAEGIPNTHIHGIEMRDIEKGVSMNVVAALLREELPQAKHIVAHNARFDIHVLCSELFRRGYRHTAKLLSVAPAYCTMHHGHAFLAGKSPTLKELYSHFFPNAREKEGWHNAYFDSLCTAKCYFKMESGPRV